MRCIFVTGTLLPPSMLASIPVPEGVVPESFDWMDTVQPCELSHCVTELHRMIGDEPAIIVAHSSGAAIAAACAIAHPDAVAGLVLINSGPHMRRHTSVRAMLERMRTSADRAMWEEFARANFATDCAEEIIEAVVDYSEKVGAEQACAILGTQAETDLSEAGPVRGIPVDIVHGADDPKRSAQDTADWLAVFPEAHIEIVPNASHTPYVERPGCVTDAIARVLHRATPSSSAAAPTAR